VSGGLALHTLTVFVIFVFVLVSGMTASKRKKDNCKTIEEQHRVPSTPQEQLKLVCLNTQLELAQVKLAGTKDTLSLLIAPASLELRQKVLSSKLLLSGVLLAASIALHLLKLQKGIPWCLLQRRNIARSR
jgi:hypothetical protein